jgi:acyl carrier protein
MNNITTDIISIIVKFLPVDNIEINENTLISELYLDSISILELIFEIETFFNITINIEEYTEKKLTENSISDFSKIVENLINSP